MFIINNVTPEALDAISATLSNTTSVVRISKTGPTGYEVRTPGILAEAVYDAVKQTLTVTLVQKPSFLSEAVIATGIQNAVAPKAPASHTTSVPTQTPKGENEPK